MASFFIEIYIDGRCPPVPDVEYCVPQSQETFEKKTVTIKCVPGYETIDHLISQVVVCDEQRWSSVSKKCQRKLNPKLL